MERELIWAPATPNKRPRLHPAQFRRAYCMPRHRHMRQRGSAAAVGKGYGGRGRGWVTNKPTYVTHTQTRGAVLRW